MTDDEQIASKLRVRARTSKSSGNRRPALPASRKPSQTAAKRSCCQAVEHHRNDPKTSRVLRRIEPYHWRGLCLSKGVRFRLGFGAEGQRPRNTS